MKVLVTGAAGFVGSHLVDALLIRGFEVIGVDRRDTANLTDARRFRRFTFVQADVTRDDLGEWVAGCDTVFDLVARPENTKSACERITLRYTDVYGPRQNPEALIPRIMRAVRTRTPIDLYGDAGPWRPLYISDAVRAALAAAEEPSATVDIAGPHVVDLDELLDLVHVVTGLTVPVSGDYPRPDRVKPAREPSNAGYRPRVSLPDGLRRYWLATADPRVPVPRDTSRFRANAPERGFRRGGIG